MAGEGWEDEEQLNQFKWLLFDNFGLKWPARFLTIEDRFGGAPQALYNFSMFASRCKHGPTQISCPQGDHYYPRFKKLLHQGIISKAEDRTTTDEEELRGLKKERLLEICEELGIQSGKNLTKAKLIETLKGHEKIGQYTEKKTFTDLYNFTPLPGQRTEGAKYDGPSELEVASFSGSKSYNVNVKAWTCSCPDWQENRSRIAVDYPGRLCKHLLAVIAENPALFPENMRPFGLIMTARYQERKGIPGGEAVYGMQDHRAFIIMRGGNDWIDFYIDDKRYGYNTIEQRWAKGENPDNPQALLAKARKNGLYRAEKYSSKTGTDRLGSTRHEKKASGCGTTLAYLASALFVMIVALCSLLS